MRPQVIITEKRESMEVADDKFNIFLKTYLARKAMKMRGKRARAIILAVSISVELLSETLLVGCNKLKTIMEIVDGIDILCELADCMGLKSVRVYYKEALAKIINVKDGIMKGKDFQLTPEFEYLRILWSREEGYQTIVRMDNGVILAASALPGEEKPTGIGLNAKRVWQPSEWRKRNELLRKDGEVVGYEYKGYTKVEVDNPLVYPEPKLYDYSVNSRIIEYFGQECILSTFERK